jgi:arabinofuranosyltransferase
MSPPIFAPVSLRRRDLLLLPLAGALIAHSLVFDFVSDDAYISFVYSRNLAELGELTFNPGERVEGYTNFLWTLLLGVLMKLGIAPELSSRVLGTAFGVATLVLVTRLSARLRGGPSLWDYLPAALLAASSGYACWCSGGLETQMFTFLVMLGVHGVVVERPVLSGVALALSAMTRPEGALVTAACGVWRLARCRLRIGREDVLWGLAFLAVWAPWFAWRWWYYGWPFPNTFYVKAGGTPPPSYAADMRAQGLFYVWQWLTQSRAVYAIPLVAAGVWRRPGFGGFCLLLTAVYLGYTVSVGGDFMGLHRFVMPLFVTTALLAAIGLEAVADRLPPAARPVCAALLAGGFAASQVPVTRQALVPTADRGIDRPGYLERYAEDRALLGKALAPRLRPDDFSVMGGAGVQPYYARMRGFDVFGLVSEDVAHNEPPVRARPGHQKWARPERVLGYNPTFLFYCYALHANPSRYQLCGEAGWFMQRGYEAVTIFVPGVKDGEYYTFLKRKDRPWP